MIAAILAQTGERVIGVNGQIPWHYSSDMRRFRRVTLGSTIVMGRKTFESIGRKPLPGRQNIVLTRTTVSGVQCANSLEEAIGAATSHDIWFIGGAEVYAAAMPHVELIDVTYVPDVIDPIGAALAPEIDETMFTPGPLFVCPDETSPSLVRRTYVRRTLSQEPYELADNRRLQEGGILIGRGN